jgi:hypothetical protein
MCVNVKQNERRKLAAKIEWLQQHKNSEVREQRTDSRFVPKDPYSRMILADGHVETCLVLDVSVSGAAISADTIPAIGTVLAVGTLTSRVVRHFDEGLCRSLHRAAKPRHSRTQSGGFRRLIAVGDHRRRYCAAG